MQCGNTQEIIEGCDYLLKQFSIYAEGSDNYKSNPKDTFKRHEEYFKLQEAVQIFSGIKNKAIFISDI